MFCMLTEVNLTYLPTAWCIDVISGLYQDFMQSNSEFKRTYVFG